MGMVIGDLDEAVNAMHGHVRKSVMKPQSRASQDRPYGGWIESGIGPEIEIAPEYVLHNIDAAGDLGAEVFFIDASWYAPPKSHWWNTVGDWQIDLAFSVRLRFSVIVRMRAACCGACGWTPSALPKRARSSSNIPSGWCGL